MVTAKKGEDTQLKRTNKAQPRMGVVPFLDPKGRGKPCEIGGVL